MQGLEWHTDLGWRLSKNISHQTDRSRYHFKLQDDNAMKIALECGAKSDDFTSIAGAPYAFETYVPETESIPAMPEADFKMAKKNLGGISASPSLENYDEEMMTLMRLPQSLGCKKMAYHFFGGEDKRSPIKDFCTLMVVLHHLWR